VGHDCWDAIRMSCRGAFRGCALATMASLAGVWGCGSRTGLEAFAQGEGEQTGDGSADAACGAPSCAPGGPGMTNCGVGHNECCCTSLEVSGGTFYRHYANAGSGPTSEAEPATVSDVQLDKYEVTVGRFRQFVAAWNSGWQPSGGSGTHSYLNGGQGLANGPGSGAYEPGWISSDDGNVAPTDDNLSCAEPYSASPWTPSVGNQENLPITCVNWFEAYAFCIWDGGFLPSQAEEEYSAAGGNEQREYPWGSTAPGLKSEYAIYGCLYPTGPSGAGDSCICDLGHVAPVGSAPLGAARWGQLDMTGEVLAWTLDAFPLGGQLPEPCVNCANAPGASSARVAEGGAFGGTTSLSPQVTGSDPAGRALDLGIRCARAP
jgi:formylglycine-generating enzyme